MSPLGKFEKNGRSLWYFLSTCHVQASGYGVFVLGIITFQRPLAISSTVIYVRTLKHASLLPAETFSVFFKTMLIWLLLRHIMYLDIFCLLSLGKQYPRLYQTRLYKFQYVHVFHCHRRQTFVWILLLSSFEILFIPPITSLPKPSTHAKHAWEFINPRCYIHSFSLNCPFCCITSFLVCKYYWICFGILYVAWFFSLYTHKPWYILTYDKHKLVVETAWVPLPLKFYMVDPNIQDTRRQLPTNPLTCMTGQTCIGVRTPEYHQSLIGLGSLFHRFRAAQKICVLSHARWCWYCF